MLKVDKSDGLHLVRCPSPHLRLPQASECSKRVFSAQGIEFVCLLKLAVREDVAGWGAIAGRGANFGGRCAGGTMNAIHVWLNWTRLLRV